MSKFKNWLRAMLTNYLGIDDLINLIDKHIDKNDSSFRELEKFTYDLNSKTRTDLNKQISHFQDSVNTLHNTVENVVHIGTDVRETDKYNDERSWAVICVEGKLNLVKFVSLDVRSARDLIDYLKQYEAGRHCIDSPHSELFYESLFKF